MYVLTDFLARVLQGLTKLFAMALLGALVLSLLLTGVCIALLSVVWSLLRGKRPAMFTVYRGFQQATSSFGRRPGTAPTARQDDVVDVQAHEVRQTLPGQDSKRQD